MKFLLQDAILINRLPEIIPAVEAVAYSPAIPATETEPEIPETLAVKAQPEKYKFFATIFIQPEGAPEKKFIQDENITFISESSDIENAKILLQTEAQSFIDKNYPS